MAPYQLPVEVAAELRAYQRDGISWLAFLRRSGLHGVLADDMGEPGTEPHESDLLSFRMPVEIGRGNHIIP